MKKLQIIKRKDNKSFLENNKDEELNPIERHQSGVSEKNFCRCYKCEHDLMNGEVKVRDLQKNNWALLLAL